MKSLTLLLVASLVLIAPAVVSAALVAAATVDRSGETYNIHFRVQIDAPIEDVTQLIGDIRNLARLSPSTQSSDTVDPGKGINTEQHPWVHVVLRPCVLIFCKTLTKVSRVLPLSEGVIRYESIVAYSSFKSAIETLRLNEAAGKTTVLTYDAQLIPGFFVPPVIGSWMVRRVIVNEISEAASRAEREIKRRQDGV